jgi:hypothetical protein
LHRLKNRPNKSLARLASRAIFTHSQNNSSLVLINLPDARK